MQSLSDSMLSLKGGSLQHGVHMKWLFVLSSLIGNYLNIRKNIWCFAFWIICDGYFAYHNIIIAEYEEAVLFIIYGLFAIWGFYCWRKTNSV